MDQLMNENVEIIGMEFSNYNFFVLLFILDGNEKIDFYSLYDMRWTFIHHISWISSDMRRRIYEVCDDDEDEDSILHIWREMWFEP